MTDIRSFTKAVKISWVKKVVYENYQADWKQLLTSDCFCWEDVWFLNKKIFDCVCTPFCAKYFLERGCRIMGGLRM